MPYTLYGDWEEKPKEVKKVKEVKVKPKQTDLFKVWYTSKEKAKEDVQEMNDRQCLLTMTKTEYKMFKRWEKEERNNK